MRRSLFCVRCTKMGKCTKFWSGCPPCIFKILFIIIILQLSLELRIILRTTNHLCRGDHWSPAQTHRSSVGMKVDINPRSGRPSPQRCRPYGIVRDVRFRDNRSFERNPLPENDDYEFFLISSGRRRARPGRYSPLRTGPSRSFPLPAWRRSSPCPAD